MFRIIPYYDGDPFAQELCEHTGASLLTLQEEDYTYEDGDLVLDCSMGEHPYDVHPCNIIDIIDVAQYAHNKGLGTTVGSLGKAAKQLSASWLA